MSDKDKSESKYKKAVLYRVPGGTLIAMRWEGGGEFPSELSGQYTSKTTAMIALDRYLAKGDSDRKVEVIDEEAEKEKAQQAKVSDRMSSIKK